MYYKGVKLVNHERVALRSGKRRAAGKASFWFPGKPGKSKNADTSDNSCVEPVVLSLDCSNKIISVDKCIRVDENIQLVNFAVVWQ